MGKKEKTMQIELSAADRFCNEPVDADELYTVDLHAEELETVIAPKLAANHNETFLSSPTLRATRNGF